MKSIRVKQSLLWSSWKCSLPTKQTSNRDVAWSVCNYVPSIPQGLAVEGQKVNIAKKQSHLVHDQGSVLLLYPATTSVSRRVRELLYIIFVSVCTIQHLMWRSLYCGCLSPFVCLMDSETLICYCTPLLWQICFNVFMNVPLKWCSQGTLSTVHWPLTCWAQWTPSTVLC